MKEEADSNVGSGCLMVFVGGFLVYGGISLVGNASGIPALSGIAGCVTAVCFLVGVPLVLVGGVKAFVGVLDRSMYP